MSLNFISKGYENFIKATKDSIYKKYVVELENAGFFKRLKIKRHIKYEISTELIKLKDQISQKSLF